MESDVKDFWSEFDDSSAFDPVSGEVSTNLASEVLNYYNIQSD